MKIKKEYILLALLIASSVGYLIFQKTDRVHYTLPSLEAVQPDGITTIDITREGKTASLKKQAESWLIAPQDWRADSTKVSEMLDVLANLAVTDLVSETKDYDRYELDERSRATIKAYAGQEPRRDLIVGKAAPTHNHTYVMLPGDGRVYLASGDLPRLFLVSPSDLRDMVVLSMTPADIDRIEIEHKGRKTALVRSEVPQDKEKNGSASQDRPKVYTWKNDRGVPVDKADVDTLLAVLAKLYCGEYLDDAMKTVLKAPETVIVMKGTGEHVLSIFAKSQDRVPALSSQSESPFVMPDYKLEEMEKGLGRILEK